MTHRNARLTPVTRAELVPFPCLDSLGILEKGSPSLGGSDEGVPLHSQTGDARFPAFAGNDERLGGLFSVPAVDFGGGHGHCAGGVGYEFQDLDEVGEAVRLAHHEPAPDGQ